MPGQTETYTIPGGSRLSVQAGQIGFPYLEPPPEAGPTEKIAAGIYNVAAGIPNFLMSPEGIATAMIPAALPARIASPLLRGTFMGLMAKGAGEQAGVASVTKDPREITEAAGAAAFIPMIAASGRLLPKAQIETTTSLRKGLEYAAKERQIRESFQRERAGDDKGRAPEETGVGGGLPAEARGEPAPAKEGPARLLLEPNKPMPAEATQHLGEEGVRHVESARKSIDHAIEIEPGVPTEIPDTLRIAMDPGNVRNQLASELGRSPDVQEINARRNQIAQEAGYNSLDAYERALRAENEPFAARRRAGEFMTIDRKRNVIRVFPEELQKWLTEDVPPNKRAQALQSRLVEESLHLKTPKDLQEPYFNSLSQFEKYAEQRIYLGKNWRARMQRGDFSPSDIGAEAIRRRLQRLARMSSSEAAETAGLERWKVGSLELLNDAVRAMREGLSPAAREQWAYIRKLTENIEAAKSGIGMEPAAARRMEQERPAPGMVRLYSGTPGEGSPSSWFTEKPERARSFGQRIRIVDVPQQVAERSRQQIKTDYVLPNEWVQKASLVGEPVAPRVWEIEEPAGVRRLSPEQRAKLDEKNVKALSLDDQAVLGHPDGIEYGVKLTEADIPRLEEQYNQAGKEMQDAFKKSVPFLKTGVPKEIEQEQAAAFGRMNFFGGAIQGASRGKHPIAAPNYDLWLQQKARETEAPVAQAAATRRGKEAEPSLAFYLPPVARGEAAERAGFPAVTPREVSLLADEHWSDITRAPSYEQWKSELESRFGSLKNESLYSAWQDAMFKKLMSAKGAEIEQIMDKLNLRPAVAKALKPGDSDPMLARGKIGDEVKLPPVQPELGEIAKFFKRRQWKTAAAFRDKFGPKLRARYAAISEIADKVMQEAGPAPEKPVSRSTIGPEDVRQTLVVTEPGRAFTDPETGVQTIEGAQYERLPGWRTLTADERKDPARLGEVATFGARVSGKKFGISQNVLVLKDKTTGRIILVDAFRDTRKGPKVSSPEGSTMEARNIDTKLLAQYEPMILMNLREPVERFHQVFENQAEFDTHFGDLPIEGTEGLRTSIFAGPQAGLARTEAGLTGAGKPPPAEAALPPPLAPAITPTGARELTLPRFARTRVPAGAIPEAAPRPAPTAMLAAPPPVPTHQTLPIERPMPYETLPRPTVPRPVTEYGKPSPRQPGTEYRAGLAPELSRRAPAGVRRNVADEFEAVKSDIGKMVKAWPVGDQPARMADSASNTANNIANQHENRVRMASAARPTKVGARLAGTWQRGDPKILAAANVLVEAKAVRDNGTIDPYKRNEIAVFRQLVNKGMAEAQRMEKSASWHERRIGRAWVRNQRNLMAELDYADAHWDDPVLQETARRMSQAFREEINLERSKGFDITQKPGYDPHRYDAALWNGESFLFQLTAYEKKILGRKFRESQLFPSYYHASAAGPYLAVTRDGATLVSHRIRQGQNMVLQNAWKEGLRDVRLPDGRPLAIDPVAGAHRRYLSPKADYVVVPGANHLAIQEGYAPLVRQLTDPSHVEVFAPTRAMLHISQQLKHSILVGDFFHLGRMIYYGMAMMGSKAGFKSGWTVLDIAERDLPEALAKGIVRQKDVDWGKTKVAFGRGQITRRALAEKFYTQMGANLGRVQDALYKDLVTALSPTAGMARRGIVRVLDPSVGRYNRFLFDRLTRGMMAEANVREFERQMKANPSLSPHKLMADISRDVNNFFGNIGRQGWFKSKTWQDTMRIMWLAPQWVEGLIKKEAISTGRLTGLTSVLGMRQGPTRLGAMGTAIGRGMLFMLGITQALNLITRRQPTWMNEEKDHKFDAWIPSWGGEGEGFWLSPLAIYNEVSHDIYRLINSKPTVAEALAQIAGNKEQPVTRAILVGMTGISPLGQKITTSAGRVREMGRALAPVPISFGKISQAAGHAAAPGLVPPPPRGAVQRQAAATLGIKIEPAETAVQGTAKMARDFMRREGLEKETGWQQIQTDEPGYSKLRSAIRNEDWKEAKRNLDALRKTRTDRDIMQAMKQWSRRGWTGSLKTEKMFLDSLSNEEMELYHSALEQKLQLYNKWLDWMWQQD